MPFVSYFVTRAQSKTLTASDVMELLGASTFTKGVKHPPHPHAHIAKEGFGVGLTVPEAQELKNLRNAPQPRAQKDEERYIELLTRETYEQEGLHLDPATRGNYSAPEYEVVDGKKRYIDRNVHSQFSDSEAAVMALYHSMISDAGKKALAFLQGHPQGRAVVHSISAANALKAGALPYKNPPKKGLSVHPDRNKAAQVVERQKGVAGNVAQPQAAMVAVTTVFDNDDGQLTVQTHYPASSAPKVSPIPPGKTELNLGAAEAAEKLTKVMKDRSTALQKLMNANNNNAKFVTALGKLNKGNAWIKDLINNSPFRAKYDELTTAQHENTYMLRQINDVKHLLPGPKATIAHDHVETSQDEDPAKKLHHVHMLYKYTPGAFAKAPDIVWTNKEPKILGMGVRSAGQACIVCGQVHGATPGLFNKWYQCDRCGSCYCPTHSQTLVAAVVVKGPQGKKCKSPNCVGVARSIY